MTLENGEVKPDSTRPLREILDACEKALFFTKGMDLASLTGDERTIFAVVRVLEIKGEAAKRTIFAVVRVLEIMGEAAKRVSPVVRNRSPEIPLRAMAGIRDRLTHDYENVDLEVAYRVR